MAKIVAYYSAAKNVVFSWTMGITHHAHGVKNVQAIANLALLRGMVGRAGSGLLPIRGHSNVQGIGSMGVMPKLKDAIFDRLENHFGVRLPTTPGRDTMACIEGAAAGELKVGFCLGGNLFGSNPDAKFAGSALSSLDQITYLSTTLNTGHAHGLARETIILPVTARDEEPEPTTQESMFNYIRLSDGGPRRHAGTRSEVDVIASIAERIFAKAEGGRRKGEGQDITSDGNGAPPSPLPLPPFPLDWSSMRSTAQIRQAIARIVPGFEKLAELDRTKQEFQISGRTFHEPRFATPDGRARMHAHDLPDLQGAGDGEIRLMTLRSEGQFNTVVYEDEDIYRGMDRRDVIMLHPDDLARFGMKDGDRITIHGPAGSMPNIRATEFPQIKPGNAAMYYPECNVLISRAVDPQSRTPAFKGVVVRVACESERGGRKAPALQSDVAALQAFPTSSENVD
ncbi:MAG: molybdopterin dinucleotide binding domain-containing protein [Pirellulales bacterium]